MDSLAFPRQTRWFLVAFLVCPHLLVNVRASNQPVVIEQMSKEAEDASRASDAAQNLTPTARGGFTVSRRMMTGTQVTNEIEFKDALAHNAVIVLTEDITLTATIEINGLTNLVINGDGSPRKVDGNRAVRCFSITNGAELSFNDLTITEGVIQPGVRIGRGSVSEAEEEAKQDPYSGAALYIKDSTATFTSCTLSLNKAISATSQGGAIYMFRSTGSFTLCIFSSNDAEYVSSGSSRGTVGHGGALSIKESTASFTSCTLLTNDASTYGGALFIQDSTASFTSCTFSVNEANYGGAIYLSADSTLNLIGYAFSDNTAFIGGGDIYVEGSATLNLNSLCPESRKYAGTGSLDYDDGCSGRNCDDGFFWGPADLSDASACTACDEGTDSCCGATECSASASSCSASELAICPAPTTSTSPPGGTCFHGATQVTLEDKSTKAMTELQVGEKIQTADINGNLGFAPIISLPHKAGNSEMATFLKIVTDFGKSVQMTPGHLIPNCAGKMFRANEVALGDCVMTVDGKEAVSAITSATHFGVYTAVTAHALIVAGGILASPFSVENDPGRHNENSGISSSFIYFLNKMSAKVSTGLRGAKESSSS